jgi:hypothetical protein
MRSFDQHNRHQGAKHFGYQKRNYNERPSKRYRSDFTEKNNLNDSSFEDPWLPITRLLVNRGDLPVQELEKDYSWSRK